MGRLRCLCTTAYARDILIFEFCVALQCLRVRFSYQSQLVKERLWHSTWRFRRAWQHLPLSAFSWLPSLRSCTRSPTARLLRPTNFPAVFPLSNRHCGLATMPTCSALWSPIAFGIRPSRWREYSTAIVRLESKTENNGESRPLARARSASR
ncbi:hypothetical protein D3C71_1711800 [compost metagenome]